MSTVALGRFYCSIDVEIAPVSGGAIERDPIWIVFDTSSVRGIINPQYESALVSMSQQIDKIEMYEKRIPELLSFLLRNGHKGERGRIGVIGGCELYTGHIGLIISRHTHRKST